jgi:hypothetical protein
VFTASQGADEYAATHTEILLQMNSIHRSEATRFFRVKLPTMASAKDGNCVMQSLFAFCRLVNVHGTLCLEVLKDYLGALPAPLLEIDGTLPSRMLENFQQWETFSSTRDVDPTAKDFLNFTFKLRGRVHDDFGTGTPSFLAFMFIVWFVICLFDLAPFLFPVDKDYLVEEPFLLRMPDLENAEEWERGIDIYPAVAAFCARLQCSVDNMQVTMKEVARRVKNYYKNDPRLLARESHTTDSFIVGAATAGIPHFRFSHFQSALLVHLVHKLCS